MKFLIFLFNYFVGVGFFMFIERKVMALVQYRLGPNKVIFKGYLQFIFDFFKLLFKYWVDLFTLNIILYMIFPFFFLLNMFILWLLVPLCSCFLNIKMGVFILLVVMLIKVFLLILLVWSVYSVYSFISIIRMVVQLISYDIVVILIFLIFVFFYGGVDFYMVVNNVYVFNFFMNVLIFFFWLMSMLVELLRLPFDFYEGESELISGFNVDFSSFYFVIFILVEYVEMVYFMFITNFFYFFSVLSSLIFFIFLFVLIFVIVWFRIYFIRYRYDKMMIVLWTFFFPLIMFIFLFYYYLDFF